MDVGNAFNLVRLNNVFLMGGDSWKTTNSFERKICFNVSFSWLLIVI